MRFTLAARGDLDAELARIYVERRVESSSSPSSPTLFASPRATHSRIVRSLSSRGSRSWVPSSWRCDGSPTRSSFAVWCCRRRRDQPTRDRGGGRAPSACPVPVISRMAGGDGRSLYGFGPAARRGWRSPSCAGSPRTSSATSCPKADGGAVVRARSHRGARRHDLMGRVVGDRRGSRPRLAAARPAGCCLRPVVPSTARGHSGSRHTVELSPIPRRLSMQSADRLRLEVAAHRCLRPRRGEDDRA